MLKIQKLNANNKLSDVINFKKSFSASPLSTSSLSSSSSKKSHTGQKRKAEGKNDQNEKSSKKKIKVESEESKKNNSSPVLAYPPNLVSCTYQLVKKPNYAQVICDIWPSIELLLPYVNQNCPVCMELKKVVMNWYSKKPQQSTDTDKNIGDITITESIYDFCHSNNQIPGVEKISSIIEEEDEKDEDTIMSLTDHPHSMVLNHEFCVNLPKIPKKRKAKVKNGNQDAGVINDNDYDGDDNKKKVEANDDDDDNADDADEKKQMALWTKQCINHLKKFLFVMQDGKCVSWASFTKFKPWPWQQDLADYIKNNYDWLETISENQHYLNFLVYVKMGAGKTPGMLYGFQGNPPPDVTVACDISILQSRWITDLFQFFPALYGTTVYQFVGYDEDIRRLKTDGVLKTVSGQVLVIDESQELRTLQPAKMILLESIRASAATFCTSGTPLQNQKSDIIGLNVLMEVSPLETMKEIEAKQEALKQNSNKKRKRGVDNEDADDKDDLDWFYYHDLEKISKEYLQQLYKEYNGRVLYFNPSNPIKTESENVFIEMTWPQTFDYIMNSKQSIRLGEFTLTSSIRNSYDTMLRRVSNCVYNADETEITHCPKFEYLADDIIKNCSSPDMFNKKFPLIIISKYKQRGSIGCEKVLRKKIADYITKHGNGDDSNVSKLRIASMTGETDPKTRNQLCTDYSKKMIDIFFLSKVGKRGLDLSGQAVTLLEVPDSDADEGQMVSRCVRWGKREAKSNNPIHVRKLIATFPSKDPTSKELNQIKTTLVSMLRLNDIKELDKYIDVLSELKQHIKQLKYTVDEKCYHRNPQKTQELAPLELVLKSASIKCDNAPQIYLDELDSLLQNMN